MKPYIVLSLFILLFVFVKNLKVKDAQIESSRFQKATYYQALSLNYTTFVASTLWVRSMIGYGEALRKKKEKRNVLDNGLVLAQIDPKFRKLYDWFPAIPLNYPEGPSKSDFEKIDRFMEKGIQNIDDPNLNFGAAMNHIGYNRNLSNEEKRHFYTVAAQFLEPILDHPKAPDRTSGAYSYFKKGGHFKDGIAPKEEAAFLSLLLVSSNEIDREPIRHRLVELGYSDAVEERKLRYHNEYILAKTQCCSYFPDDLSMAYGF